MKYFKVFYFTILFFAIMSQSFDLPKSIQKKVDKEIKTTYHIDLFLLEPITISDEINYKLPSKINQNLFKILDGKSLIGYAFIGKALGKVDDFDFLVLFDENLVISKSKILIYREDYGGEIGSKRWLQQFEGKSIEDNLVYKQDIIGISGATLSANAMTVAVNNLLKSIHILQLNKII
ncbi:MAG: FMN-binding protein [Aureibaculum sp.]